MVRAWAAGVTQLQRRFQVRQATGPSVAATGGYAEGDPLSCVTMQLLNLAHHAFMAVEAPQVRLFSFVDNYEVLADSVQDALQAEETMKSFCRKWDVQLNEDKTVVWANEASQRRVLKEADCTVVHAMRGLGGQLQFTNKCRKHGPHGPP